MNINTNLDSRQYVDMTKCVEKKSAEGQAEGATLLDMPLSIYLPCLLDRIRRQSRRIKFHHLNESLVTQTLGVQKAERLALLGAEQEGTQRVWALQDENDKALDRLQTSLASLEIEVRVRSVAETFIECELPLGIVDRDYSYDGFRGPLGP